MTKNRRGALAPNEPGAPRRLARFRSVAFEGLIECPVVTSSRGPYRDQPRQHRFVFFVLVVVSKEERYASVEVKDDDSCGFPTIATL
ncbi:hypothetical protein EVAR_49360_1 [Eumeta japonica]|uniref:Uncharacterized protein n=1 Tax=Eumeta variegata TaxID=151549 RepID=A0A4C1XU04_EUMVA|nr:hypothetical protein EVAR_49360_1 [Eumeta japonica]